MKMFLMTLVLAAGFSVSAHAGELDNEGSVTNKSMPGTLVVRLDKRTNQAAAVQTSQTLTSEDQAVALVAKANFKAIGGDKVRTELDQDGGASSWYFYSPYQYPYYTPVCNYYGNSYNPYYSYNYGYYNYYYYGSYWSYGR